MKRMILAAALPLTLLGSMATAAQKKETKIVELNGKRFRVVTQGNAVMVANKAMFVAYDVQERDDQREAVKAATGCDVVDELPSTDAKLRGKLNCTK